MFLQSLTVLEIHGFITHKNVLFLLKDIFKCDFLSGRLPSNETPELRCQVSSSPT
jgi:hypothetical protein